MLSKKVIQKLILLSFALLIMDSAIVLATDLPELPRSSIDTTYAAPTGNVININAGGNLQVALDNAHLGDTIVLQAGATFTGPFTLRNKTAGSGWIYIRSSAYSSLPAPGNRVSGADSGNMPKLTATSGGGTTIHTESRAHHYRFVGIEFKPVTGNFLYNLISIGENETSLLELPEDITFDRCLIKGDPTMGGRRGVAMNGIKIAVIDSHVSNFKEAGADTQALWASNTPGPLKIVNNYLEGAGENVMLGGSDPAIINLIPADIEIRGNHFFKPLSWYVKHPTYGGSHWSVKNLLEFKNGERVLVEGNVFENNWADAQSGFSLLFTPRNQDGGCPGCGTRDITVRLNIWKNIGSAVNILGQDGSFPSGSLGTERLHFKDNVFQISEGLDADGRLFQMLGTGTSSGYPSHVTFDHNSGFAWNNMFVADYATISHFDFKNNLVANGNYGFSGASGQGFGTVALNAIYSNWQFLKNAIIDANEGEYPGGNYFPATISAAGFVNYSNGNYRLSPASSYRNLGTDGKDLGANIDALETATACAISGQCRELPAPSPTPPARPSGLRITN